MFFASIFLVLIISACSDKAALCLDGKDTGHWKSCPECLKFCVAENLDIYDSNNRKTCDCLDTPEAKGVDKRCMLIRVRSDDPDNGLGLETSVSTTQSYIDLTTHKVAANATDWRDLDNKIEARTTEKTMVLTETIGEHWLSIYMKQ